MDNLDAIVIDTLINSSLSNYKIAQDTKISDRTIANYRNKRTKPNIIHIQTLANYFGIKPKDSGELEVLRPRRNSTIDEDILRKSEENHQKLVQSLEKTITLLENQVERLEKDVERLQETINKMTIK